MMKKQEELDSTVDSDEHTNSGRVKQICQNFLVHADSGLAYRLQQEEFATHFDRNRTHSRQSRLGVKTAREIEEEEKKTFLTQQLNLYQQKRKTEESDIELARQLQEQMKTESNSINRTNPARDKDLYEDQSTYKKFDQPSTFHETISDEQLARILQEEEQLLLSFDPHSRFKPAYS